MSHNQEVREVTDPATERGKLSCILQKVSFLLLIALRGARHRRRSWRTEPTQCGSN